ncbi:unnamed protein product, partial [Didymodactylos carnosus]
MPATRSKMDLTHQSIHQVSRLTPPPQLRKTSKTSNGFTAAAKEINNTHESVSPIPNLTMSAKETDKNQEEQLNPISSEDETRLKQEEDEFQTLVQSQLQAAQKLLQRIVILDHSKSEGIVEWLQSVEKTFAHLQYPQLLWT